MRGLGSVLPFALLVACEHAQFPLGSDDSKTPLSIDQIPHLGFGTWNLKGNVSEAVSWAIQVGYRHIDAAAIYGNEDEVGNGIADGLVKTGLTREDLWITSKLWNTEHDINKVEFAIDASLHKLRVGYLDLYHVHWPVADTLVGQHDIDYLATWGAMELLIAKGKTRHIGVCNFGYDQLTTLLNNSRIPPAVHQMEMHPYLQQTHWFDLHARHGIHVTAYSPLAGTNPTYGGGGGGDKKDETPVPLLNNSVVAKIAKKRACSPAQVVLKWGLERGQSVIPKSSHRDRIRENFEAAGCELTAKDYRKINALASERYRYNSPGKGWGVTLFDKLEDAKGKREKDKIPKSEG